MDFSFHIQQGQQLLKKQDAVSIKKALKHFVSANELTEDGDIAKPQVLYHLAYCNYVIGNLELAYKIAHKAKRSIDDSMKQSIFSMNNMRQMLGEESIDEMIEHIEAKFPQLLLFVDTEDDDFDENEVDFSYVSKLFPTTEKAEITPQFTLNKLSKDVLFATFTGLGRTNDQLIYFDKLKGNVLSYNEGYFSSLTGDQSLSNRELANKIMNSAPSDYVDEERYVLLDRLRLSDFLKNFKEQAHNKDPFFSFVDTFSEKILEDFSHNGNIKTTSDLVFGSYLQDKFHELFQEKYQERLLELKHDYSTIFENACKVTAIKWISNKIFDGLDSNFSNDEVSLKLDFVFNSSDHLRYQNGIHVSGPHGGARRAVKVEPNLNGKEGYSATIYNLDGNHPVWQNNIQMAPKQMRVIYQDISKVTLRGYGNDGMGASFADYGLTINLKDGQVEKCVLHMYDRGIDIEYLS